MTTEQTYFGYTIAELRTFVNEASSAEFRNRSHQVAMTVKPLLEHIAELEIEAAANGDTARQWRSAHDDKAARIAALEAELAPLRELWAAVEELGQAKQNTYALRTLAGDAWIVGSNGDGMEAITRPTLRLALIALAAQGGEVEDA